MRQCTQCGRELSAHARFCPVCGIAVPDSPPPPPAEITVAAVPATTPRIPPPPPPVAPPPAPPAPLPGPHPRRTRRGVVVALAAVGLVIALVGAGVTGWQLLRDGDASPGASRAGSLDVQQVAIDGGLSVLGEPGAQWLVTAEELLPGGTIAPMRYGEGSIPPEVIGFQDRFVGHVQRWDEDTDESEHLTFGLDAADGTTIWTRTDLVPECHAVHTGRLLLCQRSHDDPGIALVDPRDGEDVATQPLPPYYASFLEHGSTLYAMHRTSDERDSPLEVTAYALPGLEPRWTAELDPSLIECCHGDFGLQVEGNTLVASWINATWHIDRASGDVVGASGDEGWRLPGGYEVVDHSAGAEDGSTATSIEDPEGRTVVHNEGTLWWDATGERAAAGLAGVGDALFRLDTGATVWTRPSHLGSTVGGEWSEDQRHVLFDDWDMSRTTIVDAEDGHEVLDIPGTPTALEAEFTDDAFLSAPAMSDELRVHDLATGTESWSRDISAVGERIDEDIPALHSVSLSGASVAVAGEQGVIGFTDFPATTGSGDRGGDSDDVAYRTACGRPPEFVPTATDLAGGGMTVTYVVRAVCPGGQWLNLSQLRVPMVVDGATWADGYFDFSASPYWIPDGDGTQVRLVYDFADTTVPYTQIADAVSRGGGSGDGAGTRVIVVPCEPGPENSGDAPVPGDPAYGASSDTLNPSTGAPESAEEAQESALEALQRIAEEDSATVGELDWTAQLSSKKPGTRDDGIVYDSYDAILALHLEYRARYPDTLLAWSNDWPGSFGRKSQDYWVTLSGQSESTTLPILRWCRAEGWSDEDCWAKRLLTDGDPDTETRHKDSWPADPTKN